MNKERRDFLKLIGAGAAACMVAPAILSETSTSDDFIDPPSMDEITETSGGMQRWGNSDLGGYLYSEKLSDHLRAQLQPIANFKRFV